jgi:hypothetical protein
MMPVRAMLALFISCLPLEAAAAEDPARALGRAVFEAAGGSRLGEVSEIDFKFVVADADQHPVFEARHQWNLKRSTDRVRWTGKDGATYDAEVSLTDRRASGTINGAAAGEGALKKLGEDAFARWTNDAYWLMMPLKLLDPGAKLENAPSAPVDPGAPKLERLRLSFDRVGLTPGDVYELSIDPAQHRVVAWQMQLEGRAPPPMSSTWEEYRTVGPLVLSFRHRFGDGRVLRFEDVVVR